jgi:hypothetical protein
MSQIAKSANFELESDEDALNRELAERINSLSGIEHTSSDCWASANSMFTETAVWIASAIVLWVATLLVFTN